MLLLLLLLLPLRPTVSSDKPMVSLPTSKVGVTSARNGDIGVRTADRRTRAKGEKEARAEKERKEESAARRAE